MLILDIDPLKLLRLGHGEDGLKSDTVFSKTGRVNSYLELRILYLHCSESIG